VLADYRGRLTRPNERRLCLDSYAWWCSVTRATSWWLLSSHAHTGSV
jgi:hypothetical protein